MKKTSRIFWGLGFITAAVFLVLSQMHLITAQISVWSALIGIFMRGTSCQQHCRQKLWRDLLLSGACLADICRSAGASQSRFLECGDHRCIFDDRIQFFVSA